MSRRQIHVSLKRGFCLFLSLRTFFFGGGASHYANHNFVQMFWNIIQPRSTVSPMTLALVELSIESAHIAVNDFRAQSSFIITHLRPLKLECQQRDGMAVYWLTNCNCFMSCKGISLKHEFCLFASLESFGESLVLYKLGFDSRCWRPLGNTIQPTMSTLLPISHGQRLELIAVSMESFHDGNKGLPRTG